MPQPPANENVFRHLFPEIPENAVPAAFDYFRQYTRLGMEVASGMVEPALTERPERGSVEYGAVDPGTFTYTG